MDGTIIRNSHSNFNSSWDAIGLAAQVWNEFEANKSRYYHDQKMWHTWAQADALLLKDKSFEDIKLKTFRLISYAPGFQELFNELRGNYRTGILSNGVGFVAEEIVEQFGFDSELCLADKLLVKNGYFTGDVIEGMPERDKGRGLRKICKRSGVKPENILYVGDHLNDLPVFERVGCPVFMDNGNTDPALDAARQKVKYIITDFRELREKYDLL
jgi:HAD superfamily phosphoserine phosphatase-like hydrolase